MTTATVKSHTTPAPGNFQAEAHSTVYIANQKELACIENYIRRLPLTADLSA